MSQKGDTVSLFVTVVERHGKLCRLWAQTNTEQSQHIEGLMEEAENELKSHPTVVFDSVCVGDVFLAKFHEDKKWYRAKVKAVDKKTQQVTVFFIDYGNEENISIGEIAKGQGKHFDIPPQASQFILGDIQAKNGYEWCDVEMSGLSEQLVYGEFLGIVLNVGSVGNPPTLRVFTDADQRETVVTTAIAAGFGSRATVGMEPPLSQTILQAKKNFHVYVVFYESPLNFWIQLVANEDQLNALQEAVAAEVDDSSPQAQHVTLGTVCIAKFCDTESDFETFYRAVVTAVHQNGTCTVLYVDYGNSETLSLNKLKAMPSKFKELPSQAIQCCLHGSLSNADDFQKMLESEQIYANVASVMESGLHVVQLTEGPATSNAMSQPITSTSQLPPPTVQQNKFSNNNKVVHKTYKPLQFNVGKHVDLCISHVESSGEFHCQLLENAPRLKQLMLRLQEKYGSTGGTPLNIATPDTPCVTRSLLDNGLIYRSKIVSQNHNKVTVCHVDFGLEEQVPSSHVLFIDESLMELPSHAIHCSLSEAEHYSPTAVAKLLKQYESQTALVGGVMLKNGSLYEMELIDTSGIKDVHLIEELYNNSHNNASPKVPYNKVMLKVGQWTDIQVTFISDPSHIYCQFVSAQDELAALMEKIGAYCASSRASSLTCRDPGTPCLARYSEDGEWYRALVSGIHSSGGLDVFFVDYGNHDIVSEDCLKDIPTEFIVLPRQCFRGVLDGLVSTPSSWTEQDTAVLFNMAAEESHPTVIMKHESHDDLYVIQMFNTAGACINKDFGEATKRLSPRFISQVPPGRSRVTNAVQSINPVASRNGVTSSGATSPTAGQGWAQWENPLAQTENLEIKLLEIEQGYTNIMFESTVSPNEFYCRSTIYNTRLHDFMDSLNEEYTALKPEELMVQHPKEGMFCITKFNGAWYRAKILSITRQGANVQYVDFGNKEIVPLSDLKQLKPAHTQMPAQAVKCALASVAPAGGKWTEEACQLFEKMMDDTIMVGAFTGCGADGKHLVEIIQTTDGGQVLLHEELIRLGVAVSLAPPKPDLDEVMTSRNRPRRVSTNSTSSSGSSSTLTALKFTKPAVNVGQKVFVNIVHVETPTEFWVQVTENSTELEALMGTLEEFYGALVGDQLRLPSVKPDMACIARFSEDEVWYRAEVVKVFRGGELLVRYVDYGNYEKRTMADIWEMQSQFMRLPAQAIPCSLDGIVPPPTGWASTTKDAFEDLVLDKNLLAEIVSISPLHVLMVRLTEPTGRSQMAISDMLIQMKLAAPAKPAVSRSAQAAVKPYHPEPAGVKKELPPQDVAEGDNIKVNIVWTNDPTSFWCQKVESQRPIQELMEALNEHYETLRMKEAEISVPQPGQLCVALYNADGNWYRSRVLRTRNREAEVLYVDFGNKDRLPWSKLKVIKPEFMEIPQMALHCGLKGMEVYGGRFSPQVEEYFQDIMSQDINLKMLALPPAGGEKPHTVNIIDMNGSDAASKIAELEGRSQKPQQEVRAAKPQRQPQVSVPAPSTPPRSQQPSIMNYRSLNTPLRPGKSIALTVSNIESANSFFCQISTNEAELNDFMEKLDAHYASNGIPLRSDQVKSGMPCAAKFSEDNYWYRAQIKKIVSANEVEVLFVDYGNSEQTSVKKICPLDQQFAAYPLQAFTCILSGMPQSTSVDAVVQFRQLVENKQLQGRVKNQGPPVEVELMDPATNTNINAEMIAKFSSKTASLAGSLTYMPPQLPKEEVEVYITHVDSPGSFWVQLASQETEVQSFADSMQRYDSIGPHEEKLEKATVNALCAARYSEDEAWYRGIIEEIKGNDAIVRFVDYGNTDTANPKDLKKVSTEFIAVRPFAIHCTISSMPSTWTADQTAALAGIESTLMAKFCPTGTPTKVTLKVDGEDVAQKFGLVVSAPSDKYPERKVPTSEVPVYASHLEEGSIYVQLAEDSEKLQSISDDIQEVYKAIAEDELVLPAPDTGAVCAAKFTEDEAWYRARVEEVKGQQIKVRFVDFGNSETTTKSSLKRLTPELLSDPPLAFQCQLQGVSCPPSGWPEGFTEAVEEQLIDNEIMAKFVTMQEPHVVVLKIANEDVLQTIQTSFPAVIGTQNDLPVVQQLSATQLQGASPVQTERSNQIPVYPKQNVAEKPCTTSMSHLDSPNCIYLQLASDFDTLENITEDLQNTYTTMAEGQMAVTSVEIGKACCAKFSEDDAWYRAVIEETSGDQVTVRFVDFGNVEVTSRESLKELIPDLLCKPAGAFKCSLHELVMPAAGWPEGIVGKLEELVLDQELQTEFVSKTSPFSVKMTVGEDDISTMLRAQLPEDSTSNHTSEPADDGIGVSAGNAASLPQPTTLMVGDTVFVSAVDSPNFYVQKEIDTNALEEFMEEVSHAHETGTKLTNPVIGQFCCAKYSEDEAWYRAVIMKVADDITVRFCDYGNTDVVQLSDLIELPPSLSQQKTFAAACQLKDAGTTTWSDEQTDKFTELTNEKQLEIQEVEETATVVSIRLSDGDVDINLVMGCSTPGEVDSEDDFQEVAEEMEKIEEPINNEPVTEPAESEEFIEASEEMDEIQETTPPVVTEVIEEDEFVDVATSIEKNVEPATEDNSANISETESCEVETAKPLTDQCSEASEEFTDANDDQDTSKLQPGDIYEVQITHINSPSRFWCQRTDVMDDFETTNAAVTENCEGASAPGEVKKGEIYGARYEDDTWCRVSVVKEEDEQVRAFFIDFGNTEMVYKSDLRPLPKSLTEHSYAFPCLLHGVSTSDNLWSADSKICFEELALDKKLVAKVVAQGEDDVSIITLLDMGISVAEKMIEYGRAIKCATPAYEKDEQPTEASPTSQTESPLKSEEYTYRDMDQAKSTLFFDDDDDDATDFTADDLVESSLEDGERAELMISHAESFESIYIQLKRQQAALDELIYELQEAYDTSGETTAEFQATVEQGLFCAARSVADETWYRATLLGDSDSEGNIKAQFIDYGNTETIEEDRLQPIKPKFQTYEKMCIRCRLHDSDNLSSDAFKTFVENTKGKRLLGMVKEFKDGIPSLKLLDMGTDVLSSLLVEGADVHKAAENAVSREENPNLGMEAPCNKENEDANIDELQVLCTTSDESNEVTDSQTTRSNDAENEKLVSDTAEYAASIKDSQEEDVNSGGAEVEDCDSPEIVSPGANDGELDTVEGSQNSEHNIDAAEIQNLPTGAQELEIEDQPEDVNDALSGTQHQHLNAPDADHIKDEQFTEEDAHLIGDDENQKEKQTASHEGDIVVKREPGDIDHDDSSTNCSHQAAKQCVTESSDDSDVEKESIEPEVQSEEKQIEEDMGAEDLDTGERASVAECAEVATMEGCLNTEEDDSVEESAEMEGTSEDQYVKTEQHATMKECLRTEEGDSVKESAESEGTSEDQYVETEQRTTMEECLTTEEGDSVKESAKTEGPSEDQYTRELGATMEECLTTEECVSEEQCEETEQGAANVKEEDVSAETVEDVLSEDYVKTDDSASEEYEKVEKGVKLEEFVSTEKGALVEESPSNEVGASEELCTETEQGATMEESLETEEGASVQESVTTEEYKEEHLECGRIEEGASPEDATTQGLLTKEDSSTPDLAEQEEELLNQQRVETSVSQDGTSPTISYAEAVRNPLPVRDHGDSDEDSEQVKEVEDEEIAEIHFQYAQFAVGENLEVTTSAPCSPKDFWCQLIKPSTTDLPLLSDRIQDYCTTESDSTRIINATSNMPCFARCSLDGNWYRGLITKVCDDIADVCYVDYGNSEKAKTLDLKKVTPEFLDLNAQAFRCRLSGVVPNGGTSWDETSCARFEELVADANLQMTVVSKVPGKIVGTEELTVILHDGDVNIADILLQGGYAQPKEYISTEDVRSTALTDEQTLDPESVLNVTFCGTPMPDDFFLKAKDCTEELEQLLEVLLKKELNEDVVMEVGQPVLVHSKRAIVKEVSEDQCRVDYVDDGTKETVSKSELKKLPAEGLALPPQAFKCKLAGIEAEAWTEEAVTFFQGFMKCERLSIRVADVDKNTHLVYLYDLDDPSGTSVNYQLVSRSFAWVLADSELLNLDDSNAEELVTNQDMLESSFLEVNEERRQSLGELGVDRELGGAGDAEEEQGEVLRFQAPALSVGETVELKCLSAKDPDTLLCQLTSSQTEFGHLVKDLNDTCGKDVGETLDMSRLHSGDASLAYAATEEAWRRAKILVKEEDNLAVHFVDFGDGATVPLDKVRSINQSALALPVQAVTCSVDRIKPKDAEWSSEAVSAVRECCVGKQISVTISTVMEDGRLVASVKIGDVQDVAEMLVSAGHAEWSQTETADSETVDTDSGDEASVATETGSGGALDEDSTGEEDNSSKKEE